MKKTTKLLSILLLLAMLITVLPLTSLAASLNYTGTIGNNESFWFHQNYDDEVASASIENGYVPGMHLSYPNPAAVTLSGTPTESGNYTVYISVQTQSGSVLEYTLYIDIKDPAPAPTEKPTEPPTEKPSEGTPKITKHPTGEKVIEGDSAVFIARADHVRQYAWEITIADAVLGVDQLKSYIGGNVKVSGANSEKLTISNIPKALDGAYVRCRFVGAEESVYSEYAKITVTALEKATPTVTKSPTDETVDEGGEASFVAAGKYILKYEWKLQAADGKVYTCADAAKTFNSLKVSGANSEKLTLSNIPASLDGAKIFCEFSAGATVATDKAQLTVIPKPTEAPTEIPTEVPTEAPTEAPKPAETEVPQPLTPEKADDIGSGSNESGKEAKDNTSLVIAIIVSVAVVAVAGIAAFVILKLYGKK